MGNMCISAWVCPPDLTHYRDKTECSKTERKIQHSCKVLRWWLAKTQFSMIDTYISPEYPHKFTIIMPKTSWKKWVIPILQRIKCKQLILILFSSLFYPVPITVVSECVSTISEITISPHSISHMWFFLSAFPQARSMDHMLRLKWKVLRGLVVCRFGGSWFHSLGPAPKNFSFLHRQAFPLVWILLVLEECSPCPGALGHLLGNLSPNLNEFERLPEAWKIF